MKKLIHIVLNFLLPQKCLGCGEENDPPVGGLCQECLKRIDYPFLKKANNIFAAADYNDKFVKKAVWMLKYRKVKQLAKPLAELMHQRLFVGNLVSDKWIIIPIPLSKNRFKERGFNQAELIARYLAEKVSAPMLNNVLVKIKETPSQVSIKNREERLNNLQGAFAVKNPHLIANKNIILVDDVSTTGATINEARKILKNAGAKKVLALVVARG
ncbi:MAG: ComF family protein [Candidatus Terrybacteria bacterium]|nr:ComF family protein [Candidatus Terrybacteria bacterium]